MCKDAELFLGIYLINHILPFLDDSEIKSATEQSDAEPAVPESGSDPGLPVFLSFREVINTKKCMIFTYSIRSLYI